MPSGVLLDRSPLYALRLSITEPEFTDMTVWPVCLFQGPLVSAFCVLAWQVVTSLPGWGIWTLARPLPQPVSAEPYARPLPHPLFFL